MADDDAQARPPDESQSGDVVLAGRYRLQPGARLPELDMAGTEAVAARDQRNPGDLLFARVCPEDALPRVGMMMQLRHMQEANVLRPLEWGQVEWPGSPRPRFAVIFTRPEHGALMPAYTAKITPMASEDISHRVLGPAVLALGYLGQRSMVHRAIRPDNLYYVGEARNSIMLGDCVTAPVASTQPVIFETIESGMTPPLARGKGMLCDDFYSLGVTLLLLSLGQCPVAAMRDDELIHAKLQKGSYSALMAGHRPPFGMRELLRGLLADDPAERWGLEELEQWLGGSLRRSVQQHKQHNADRPFAFAGKDYTNCRALAAAFGSHWEDANKAIRSEEFDKWLRRGTADTITADRVASALQADPVPVGRTSPSGRLVARICMILDRPGPVRYKRLVTMPSGLGTVLASAYRKGDRATIQLVAECISSGAVLDWFFSQPARIKGLLENEFNDLKHMQQLLRHTGPGYGVERCLYMLNADLPCLSPALHGRPVISLRELLPALEQIVAERGELPSLVDRHLAAFIASRIKKNIDRMLAALEDRKDTPAAARLGMLTVLARLQAEFGPDSLPYLTEWLSRELEPTLDRFNSRTRRDQLKSRLDAIAGTGSLIALNKLVNDDTLFRRDEGERRLAKRELTSATREIAQLESNEFQDSARRTGWQVASGISGTVAMAAIAVVFIW